jgi:ABC-type uncharacterized transport system permease subunit
VNQATPHRDIADLPAWRVLATTVAPFVLLATVLLVLAYWWLDPTPPRRVVLATGVDQGAYSEFGKRYAALQIGRAHV